MLLEFFRVCYVCVYLTTCSAFLFKSCCSRHISALEVNCCVYVYGVLHFGFVVWFFFFHMVLVTLIFLPKHDGKN